MQPQKSCPQNFIAEAAGALKPWTSKLERLIEQGKAR